MKIRWTDGSIRFRITPSELDSLQDGDAISAELALPDGGWRAVVRPGCVPTALCFQRGAIRVYLSMADLERLSAPDAEGVYFRTEGERPVRYYIEKDFPCVHPGAPEAQELPTETFAPPPGFKQRHTAVCG